MQEAVVSGGGEVVSDAGAADGLIWTDPRYPERLKEILTEADPMWVQLPFAGIERFFEAGVIDAGRRWTCTKGTYGPACAEHALALMLAAARHLPDHIRAKSWRGGTFGQPERRLEGTTALIVGTGGIGAALVSMLEPLGVRTLAINRSGKHLEGTERTGTSEDLYSFAGEADHVVVAASLTPQTKGMFDSVAFEAMTEDAWLVNVARGGLVVTDDLVDAIVAGRIGGAALDVTDPEPLPDGHPLWELDNVIITPHVANTWDMAVPELLELVTRNVSHFAAGEPLEGVVDVDAGY
jgi:phosphoglycerate dehydrogenase-like enzyme